MQVTTTSHGDRFRLTRVLTFPRDIVKNWFVISSLVRRELKGRYMNSMFGAIWSVITPLFMLAVYTIVFAGILQAKWDAAGLEEGQSSTMMYALMIYCAMTPWLAFAESMTRGTGIIMENANLIKKVAFPSESLPVFVVAYTLINELIGFAIFIIALPFFPGFDISDLAYVVWYPLVVFLRLLFTLGMVFIVSSLNVFVRDVGQIVGLGMMLWMFLTPIFYAKEMLEKTDVAWVMTGMQLNPWYYIVTMYRDIFLRHKAPDPATVLTIFGIGLTTFILGYCMFMASKMKFADEI